MKFLHLAEHIYHRPWFITPEAHAAIRHVFERALSDRPALAESAPDLSALFPQRRPLAIDSEGIASIHLLGPLGKNLSALEKSCGATGFEQLREDYAAAQSAGARGIILDVDSPGGTACGTPEIASLVAACPLPTVAYTEDMMASAAYYICAGARAIVASQSAQVGSIGTYIPWMDSSAQYAAAGLKPDPIVGAGGDLKAMGFGGTLTPEQRAHLQAEVDELTADFKHHVLAYRVVDPFAMRGQTLTGRQALATNLIDALGDRTTALAILRQRL